MKAFFTILIFLAIGYNYSLSQTSSRMGKLELYLDSLSKIKNRIQGESIAIGYYRSASTRDTTRVYIPFIQTPDSFTEITNKKIKRRVLTYFCKDDTANCPDKESLKEEVKTTKIYLLSAKVIHDKKVYFVYDYGTALIDRIFLLNFCTTDSFQLIEVASSGGDAGYSEEEHSVFERDMLVSTLTISLLQFDDRNKVSGVKDEKTTSYYSCKPPCFVKLKQGQIRN